MPRAERTAGLHDDEIIAHLVDAFAHAGLDAARERHEGERAADGESDAEDGQTGPHRPSSEITPRQAEEIHATVSPTIDGDASA